MAWQGEKCGGVQAGSHRPFRRRPASQLCRACMMPVVVRRLASAWPSALRDARGVRWYVSTVRVSQRVRNTVIRAKSGADVLRAVEDVRESGLVMRSLDSHTNQYRQAPPSLSMLNPGAHASARLCPSTDPSA